VFADFRRLAAMVQADFPRAHLAFLAIKPSKARWDEWPIMAEANRLIKAYSEAHANLGYVDVATPLLNQAGEPKDVFVLDGLHLNEQGYALWQQVLAPELARQQVGLAADTPQRPDDNRVAE